MSADLPSDNALVSIDDVTAFTYAESAGVGVEIAREVLRRTPLGTLRSLDLPRGGDGVRVDLDDSTVRLGGKRFSIGRLLVEANDGITYATGGPLFDDGGRLGWSGVVGMENGACVLLNYGPSRLDRRRQPTLNLDLLVPELDTDGEPMIARLGRDPRTIVAVHFSESDPLATSWNDCDPEWAAENIERLSKFTVVYPDDVDRSRRATWSRIN